MVERIRKMSLKELRALEALIVEEKETRVENKLSDVCLKIVKHIDELLASCHELNRHYIGEIEIDCEECDRAMDMELLADGILESVRNVLADYIKE